jgi:hypothetical protein
MELISPLVIWVLVSLKITRPGKTLEYLFYGAMVKLAGPGN